MHKNLRSGFRSLLSSLSLTAFLMLVALPPQAHAQSGAQAEAGAAKPAAAVQLGAKKLGKKGASQKKSKSISRAQLPVPGKFNPLFAAPSAPPAWVIGDLVGRDPSVAAELDWSLQAASTRVAQIRQGESDFKLQQPSSPQALQVGTNLALLYEEQCLYLENLRGQILSDKNYPDINHFVKAARSQLVAHLNAMTKRFPNSDLRQKWKATQLISRIKIGDPSVKSEVGSYLRSQKNSDASRVALVAMAWDYMGGKSKSSFGEIEDAIDRSPDAASKSAFKLYAAEQFSNKKQNAKALAMYEDAAKEGNAVRRPDGSAGTVTARSVARMIQLSLQSDPENVDTERVASLQSVGFGDSARYYVEQVALRNIARQPLRAMKNYEDILALAESDATLSSKIEFRILDIAIGTRDLTTIEGQWQRIAKLPTGLNAPGVEARVLTTQNMAWADVEKKATGANVERFVRLHDFFAPAVPSYGQNDQWALRTVDSLWRIKRVNDVAARGDDLAGRSKNAGTQTAALRFSARARETMLGISPEPAFVRGKRLAAGSEISNAYVVTLDKLAPLVKGTEGERTSFQAAYISHVSGNDAGGKTRFDDSINKYARGKYAQGAVSYLLDVSLANQDFAGTEKTARLAESSRISPAKKEHKNLRALIETAVFAQANQLAGQQQFEAAGAKFVAFQKEFPRSKNGPVALNLAVKNYLAAQKVDVAIVQMESLLAQYPNSPFAKETRWQAAEQSKAIGNKLKAANHYEAFARTYKPEGKQRQAWFKAAEMHKGLGRYASAITDYETYMKETTSKGEKIRVAKEIADMQFKFGKSTEALAAYDRVLSLSKSLDDEIYCRSQMVEIYLVLNQEGNARRTIEKVLSIKPSTQEGFKTLSKAKFALARMEARDLREVDPMKEANLKAALAAMVKDYEKAKALFLASCEVPGSQFCSVGYYETARLGEEVAKKLLDVEMPPTLDPKEVQPIRNIVTQNGERIGAESKSFAQQAEQALASGAPDADTAERIRSYAQQTRGEQAGDAPVP